MATAVGSTDIVGDMRVNRNRVLLQRLLAETPDFRQQTGSSKQLVPDHTAPSNGLLNITLYLA